MITCEVRFSYLNAFEPKETPSKDLKYSASLLIPKTNENGVKEIKDAINKAVQAGIDGNKFSKAQVGSLRLPLRDGDVEHENGSRGPEYKGHYFINASSKNKPGIVGPDAKPLFDAEEFFSGCYGRADIGFFPYNQAGNRGIGVGLNNLMMTREGERLDGRQKAEDAFAQFAQAADEVEDSGDLE
jgi:hypothetical protein